MQKMNIDKIVIRGILRYYLKNELNSSETSRLIYEFEGENAMNFRLTLLSI